ncbi:MAG: riboflavin synthase [Phycisphaerales bacterium]|nr:MAG: riboflavin synthase [Phycisphaerales bacterium]
MFTGIVQCLGRVASLEERPFGARLVIDAPAWERPFEHGESVSVNGCCLTLATWSGSSTGGGAGAPARALLGFDVVRETLARTTLGRLEPGRAVNLERSATPMTLMGGHVVQGHIDGVGRIVFVRDDPADWRIGVAPEPSLMEYAAPKGSVTIEGVSLTIAAVTPGGGHFEIALIPTTLERTTLGAMREGDACNVEMDTIAKTVVHWLRHYGGR